MAYCRLPYFVLGFHGCDKSVKEALLLGKTTLILSNNDYDWLGKGMYFGENDPDRAMTWAKYRANHPPKDESKRIKDPAVIGAIIDLGNCLNLFDEQNLNNLRVAYDTLVEYNKKKKLPMPQNKDGARKLDCAVINTLHSMLDKDNMHKYDSVRCPFWEGEPLYTNAYFKTKNHIQISVLNYKCIKGYFDPINQDETCM